MSGVPLEGERESVNRRLICVECSLPATTLVCLGLHKRHRRVDRMSTLNKSRDGALRQRYHRNEIENRQPGKFDAWMHPCFKIRKFAVLNVNAVLARNHENA